VAASGDDVTLRGELTAADAAGSTDTDRLSAVRQRSDGVEHPQPAVALSHKDTYVHQRRERRVVEDRPTEMENAH